MQTVGLSNRRKGSFLRFYRLCSNFYTTETAAPHRAQPLDTEYGFPHERYILLLTENPAGKGLSSADAYRRTQCACLYYIVFQTGKRAVIVAGFALLRLFFECQRCQVQTAAACRTRPVFLAEQCLHCIRRAAAPLEHILHTLAQQTLEGSTFEIRIAVLVLTDRDILTAGNAVTRAEDRIGKQLQPDL